MQVPVVRKEVAGDLEKEDGHLDDLEEGEEEEDPEEDFESRYGPVVSVYNLAHLSHKDTGLCDISVCEEIAIGESIGPQWQRKISTIVALFDLLTSKSPP